MAAENVVNGNVNGGPRKPRVAHAADVLPMKKAKVLAAYFLGEGRLRYAALVALGAGLGLRISDAIAITWRDIVDEAGKIRDRVYVREKKTGQTRVVVLMPWVREVLAKTLAAQNGAMRLQDPVVGKLSRQRAWLVLKQTAAELGWPERVSTHSLRKAFCDMIYEKTRDPVLAARLTGHRNPAHLLRYIRRSSEVEERVWERVVAGNGEQ